MGSPGSDLHGHVPDGVLIPASSIKDVICGLSDIRDTVRANGLAIVRGLIVASAVEELRVRLGADLRINRDITKQPRIVLGCPDYQRLDDGIVGSVKRLTRTFFCFDWNPDRLGARPLFLLVSAVRNTVAGFPEGFGRQVDASTRFCDVSRIIQYPRGGGCISAHCDSAPTSLRERAGPGFRNYTALLTVTKLGVDFRSGGGWVGAHAGDRVYWEEFAEPGDVVIYDNAISHGVDPVDSGEPLELGLLSGRVIVNCYFYAVEKPQHME